MIQFICLESLNYVPSSRVFYEELKKRTGSDIEITDPGKYAIDEVKKKIGAADIVVLDISLLIAMGINPINSIDFYIVNKKPRSFYLNVWDIVNNSSKPLFLFSPSSDLNAINFGLKRQLYIDLLGRCEGIFWPYYRCPVQVGTIPEKYNSILPSFKIKDTDLVSVWQEVTSSIKINIDLPHCISPREMILKSRKKKWDLIIPGAGYKTREIALAAAEGEELKIAPFNKYRRWLVTAPYYLYKKILPARDHISFQQKNSFFIYRYMISHSAVTFTCGSELKYFVRKFLEIPAFRSAMLAYPSDNFKDYGFENGVHYLQTFPEETGEKTQYLLKNKSLADKLVQNAWNLVAEKHSAAVRVEQVLDCINAFQQGKLKSAGYYDGKFEILSYKNR